MSESITQEKQPGKPGNPVGVSQIRNEGVKKIQALAMMRELALGKTVKDVALQFNTSRAVVKARLSYAQRAGLFVRHEDVILTQMVPAAEKYLLHALSDPTMDPALKIKVALEVHKGTGLFRKPGTAAPAALQGANKKSQATLEDYINKLRQDDGTLPEGEIFDAEYSDAGESPAFALAAGLYVTAGEEPAGASGDDGAHGEASEAPGAPPRDADEASGDGDGAVPADVSGEVEQGPGESRGGHSEGPEGPGSDAGDTWVE